VEVRRKAPGQPDTIYDRLAAGLPCVGGPIFADFVTYSYIAHFVEVSVEPGTRRIRVRASSASLTAGGSSARAPRQARCEGRRVGIGATLREASEVDPRYGGFLNADLAEYVLPVNADIGSIDVEFIDEPDLQFNSAGAKGVGEYH